MIVLMISKTMKPPYDITGPKKIKLESTGSL